jgi:putative inorganic carbon (hco3(-)) transporter
MVITTIVYLLFFFVCILGSIVYHPILGLIGYLFTYNINPLYQWWGSGIPAWISRYALILGTATFIGTLSHYKTLKFKKLLDGQEILLLAYAALVALSIILGLPNPEPENNFIKMAKVAFMLIIASHIITTLKRYEQFLYIMILVGLVLGIQTYYAPSYFFNQGRFQSGIGGSDFSDGNILSVHFVMILPLLGIVIILKKWWIKCICALSAAFIINGIVLIKSRGSFIALIICAVLALLISNKVNRKKLIPYLFIALAGSCILLDPGYLTRMGTVQTHTEDMDGSSAGRIHFWSIALKMARDYPLGIGEGNFSHYVGKYDIELTTEKDTHNTYLRCLTELGFQGLFVLLLLIANAFRILSQISKLVVNLKTKETYFWHIYGLRLALIGYLIAAFFISATYVEDMFWLLMYPLFLKRCVENEELEAMIEDAT